jgi:hypothetical protein
MKTLFTQKLQKVMRKESIIFSVKKYIKMQGWRSVAKLHIFS